MLALDSFKEEQFLHVNEPSRGKTAGWFLKNQAPWIEKSKEKDGVKRKSLQ